MAEGRLIVRTLAATYYDGCHLEAHAHRWHQLIYAASGVMRVELQGALWLVPPAQAVWAPAGMRHAIRARGAVAMRTLYLAPASFPATPAEGRLLQMSPLMRELVLHIVAIGMLREEDPIHRRLAGVLEDQLSAADRLPLSLPLPRDRRAAAAADRLLANPGDSTDLPTIARQAGASARTLQRLFLDQTGLSFVAWRQRVRLLESATLLASGASVTEAGLEAGYASTSAFIAAFRKLFGRTPSDLRPFSGRTPRPAPRAATRGTGRPAAPSRA